MIVVVGVTTSRRHVDGDHDDGDHGVVPVTRKLCRCFGDEDQEAQDDGDINVTYELHVILILLCTLFCLERR